MNETTAAKSEGEGVREVLQVKSGTPSAEIHWREHTTVLERSGYDVDDLMCKITEYSTHYSRVGPIPAPRQRLILASLITVLGWEQFGEAIDELVSRLIDEIIEKVACCSLEDPDRNEAIDIEVGDLIEYLSLPELLNEAADCLPYIAGDLLVNPK